MIPRESVASRQLLLFLMSFLLTLTPTRCQLIESVSVLENSDLGTVVYDLRERLLRILQPGQLANVTAYAGQQDLFWPFALKDLRIVVARPLDREVICEKQKALNPRLVSSTDCPAYHCCQVLHVNVVVSPTSPTQVVFIRVAVQDVNDNAPTFPHVESPFTAIPEDIAVGDKILLPEATDADSHPFGVVEYRIARWVQGNASHFQLSLMNDQEPGVSGGDGSSIFRYMKTGRPYLSVVHPLDRECVEIYEFVLEAVDGGNGDGGRPFIGTVNIIIRVRDINDNAPLFDQKVYNAIVQENTLPRQVVQFKISDMDAGENGRVFINIVDPTHRANNLFRVSLQSTHPSQNLLPAKYPITKPSAGSHYVGSLHLLEYLDAEQLPHQIKFYIIATDNGHPALSAEAEVNINLLNVNDQAPHIAFLREGKRLSTNRMVLPEVLTAPESIVAEVHVTDADSNLAQLSCRITSEEDAFSLTEVTPFAGAGVTTGGHLLPNFGQQPSFLFSYRQFTLRTKHDLDREKKAIYMVSKISQIIEFN